MPRGFDVMDAIGANAVVLTEKIEPNCERAENRRSKHAVLPQTAASWQVTEKS
jgi:hypothetical protein